MLDYVNVITIIIIMPATIQSWYDMRLVYFRVTDLTGG